MSRRDAGSGKTISGTKGEVSGNGRAEEGGHPLV